MLLEERRQKLLDIVNQRGYVPLPELVAQIGVSESTVRRDLEHLHEAGLVRRTHGGAIAVNGAAALPAFEERTGRSNAEKIAIGQRTAAIIEDGETVLLDGGTTTLEVARCLVGRTLQVVTNSLPIAHLLAASRSIDLVLLGGYVYPKTGVALGAITQQALKDLHVRRLVMSVGGATERGLYNGNVLLVETERAMMRCAEETVVVADHSKFGRQALAFLDDWSGIHRVVVDEGLTEEQRAMVPSHVEVIVATAQRVHATEERV
jgi:DeoR/GlpR family transcriptional regulator of sugar metabolism